MIFSYTTIPVLIIIVSTVCRIRYFIVNVSLCILHGNTFVNVVAGTGVKLIHRDFFGQRERIGERSAIHHPPYYVQLFVDF